MELHPEVAVILHEAHVFSDDVSQSRSEEAVLNVEGVQVVEGLLEGVAGRLAARHG